MRTDLHATILRAVFLPQTKLEQAQLCVNDPRRVWRTGVRLVGVIVGGADLRQTDLRWAQLGGPDLKNADQCRTILADADLRRTQLRGGGRC